jgi:hypothetical protein
MDTSIDSDIAQEYLLIFLASDYKKQSFVFQILALLFPVLEEHMKKLLSSQQEHHME